MLFAEHLENSVEVYNVCTLYVKCIKTNVSLVIMPYFVARSHTTNTHMFYTLSAAMGFY